MHDIRTIRDNPAAFDAALARRGIAGMSEQILSLDENRRGFIRAADTATAEQNVASKAAFAARERGDNEEFEAQRSVIAERKAWVALENDRAKQDIEIAKQQEMEARSKADLEGEGPCGDEDAAAVDGQREQVQLAVGPGRQHRRREQHRRLRNNENITEQSVCGEENAIAVN